ncbi:MAG: peptidylprolyl isomerase, partial [Flavobacteriales bacterium]|nr:peptidylprolyl isomerase [Flavobacteriales bacterium]
MKKMLLIPLLFAGFAAIQAQEADPVLLTVGKSEIRKSEFERIYRKNNPKGSANETSVDDYLGLFINFKLKVNEAMAEGLDTSQSFVTELKGYREQLAKPYLTDNEVTDHLIKEAFDRSQYDLVVSHMLVKLDRYPKPEDTLAAYKKAMQLYQRISGGKETFDQVASSVAADPNGPIIREDMTFTALSLVYNFETAAYNANVGEVTKPVRTRFGYHVILVREKRPALGQVKVAHILISVPKGAPKAVEDGAKMKIDEAYAKLKDGADFADLAREYSSDRNSAERGGNLPWFRTGRMVSEFEDATAKLAEIGDYSAPFRTNYGWHVIKLLDRKGVSDFETMLPELKEKISRDERSKISTHSRVAQIQQEYGFKENTKTIAPFRKLADQSIYEKKWNRDRANGLSEVMFTLGKQEYTQSDFADFIEQNQRMGPKNMQPADFINVLYHDFVEFSCLAYEDARLEQKYPEFRDLVNEYHDGILLFEMMDKKVWSRAVKDTSGLE